VTDDHWIPRLDAIHGLDGASRRGALLPYRAAPARAERELKMRVHVVTGAVAVLSLGAIVVQVPTAGAERVPTVRVVELRDTCDPVSFNLALGAGVCVAHTSSGGATTFDEFLAELNPDDFGHGQWRNNPDDRDIRASDSLRAVVRGGETHTFTEVDEFRPGCLEEINAALELTENAPTPEECGKFFAETSVPVGGSLSVVDLHVGEHHFQCMIHPWMRTDVTVRRD
jgi:hypothetical protein